MTAAPGAADPAGHGAGRIGAFTVLFDAGCPVCRTARRWLAARDQLVPLRFVAAGSAEARRLFPTLDHAATLRDLTVVGDEGSVYAGDSAWVACLWTLTDYRALAEQISSPALLPTARRFIAAASAARAASRTPGPPVPVEPRPAAGREPHLPPLTAGWEPRLPLPADYGGGCDDRCR